MLLVFPTNMFLLLRKHTWCHPSKRFFLVCYGEKGPLNEPKQAAIPALALCDVPPYCPVEGTTLSPYKAQRGKTPKSLIFPKGVDFLNKYSKVRTYQNPSQMRKTVKSTSKEVLILTEVNRIKVGRFLWSSLTGQLSPETQTFAYLVIEFGSVFVKQHVLPWFNSAVCQLLTHCSNKLKRSFEIHLDKNWARSKGHSQKCCLARIWMTEM